jgi:hypothetical protein
MSRGCGDGTKLNLPVIAQSMVFPNGFNPIITRSDNLDEPVNLGDMLAGGQHSHGLKSGGDPR